MTVEVRHGDERIGHGGMTVDVFEFNQEGVDFADWLREDMGDNYIVEVETW